MRKAAFLSQKYYHGNIYYSNIIFIQNNKNFQAPLHFIGHIIYMI